MTFSRHIGRSVFENLEGRICFSASISIDETNGFQVYEHETIGFPNSPGGPLMAPFHVQGIPYDAGQFQATIDWHDGTFTKGGISKVDLDEGNSWELYATLGDTRTMGDAGPASYTITISQVGHPEVFATGSANFQIDDYELRGTGKPVYANVGSNQLRNVTLATFDDGEPGNGFTDATGTASNFTATINWGDGTMSAGTILATALKGRYSVVGSHTYNSIKAHTYPASVRVVDKNGGASVIVLTTATIYDAPVIKPVGVVTAPAVGGLFSTSQVTNVWDA